MWSYAQRDRYLEVVKCVSIVSWRRMKAQDEGCSEVVIRGSLLRAGHMERHKNGEWREM
eukprot:c15823_g1_i1 orf=66-242(+)